MARDTYEMTSPMRVLYYALGVAKYIPPTIRLSSRRRKGNHWEGDPAAPVLRLPG